MVTIGETAKITTSQVGESGDLLNAAWLVWRSATEECKRKGVKPKNGQYKYVGTLRSHVRRLWPTMDKDERITHEKAVYRALKEIGMATCIKRSEPTTWSLAETWGVTSALVVPINVGIRYTASERRLTPHEAGEDLPPGEVTSRQKETPTPMPNPKPLEALRPSHEKRHEDMMARRALVLEFISETITEPVVAEEVAHAFGVNVSTARTDLASLVDSGKIFTREETVEERSIRYGGTPFARRSLLYWGSKNVPARTEREVVEGYVVERADREPGMSRYEINRRLWGQLKRKGSRATFSAQDLADKAGVHVEAVRVRLRELVTAGGVKSAGTDGLRNVFKVADTEKIRKHLGQPPAVNGDKAEPEKPKAKKPIKKSKPAEPTKAEPSDLIERALQILEENNALREMLAERDERIAVLEQELEEATAPAPQVDPKVAEALATWTPYTG